MINLESRKKYHREWMRKDRARHPKKYREIERKRRPQVREYCYNRYHSDSEFRARIKQHAKNNHNKKRKRLDELKAQPCMDCGGKYPPWVMEFDHVNGDKKFTVSQIYSHSFKKIEEEAKKCELVCANCHRIRSHKRWLDLKKKEDTVTLNARQP